MDAGLGRRHISLGRTGRLPLTDRLLTMRPKLRVTAFPHRAAHIEAPPRLVSSTWSRVLVSFRIVASRGSALLTRFQPAELGPMLSQPPRTRRIGNVPLSAAIPSRGRPRPSVLAGELRRLCSRSLSATAISHPMPTSPPLPMRRVGVPQSHVSMCLALDADRDTHSAADAHGAIPFFASRRIISKSRWR